MPSPITVAIAFCADGMTNAGVADKGWFGLSFTSKLQPVNTIVTTAITYNNIFFIFSK